VILSTELPQHLPWDGTVIPMSYKLTIIQKPAYLHIVVTGANSKENVARYFSEVRKECAVRNCSRVLIEERLEGPRLPIRDVFDIVAQESRRAKGQFKAIAYVDVHAAGTLMMFAEDVAVSRGVPAKVFSSVSEAEKWLLEKDQEGSRA
jgi:hypothetical protein